jgi:hypothetical protein
MALGIGIKAKSKSIQRHPMAYGSQYVEQRFARPTVHPDIPASGQRHAGCARDGPKPIEMRAIMAMGETFGQYPETPAIGC